MATHITLTCVYNEGTVGIHWAPQMERATLPSELTKCEKRSD